MRRYSLALCLLACSARGMEPAPIIPTAASLCKGIFKGKLTYFRVRDVSRDGHCGYYVLAFGNSTITPAVAYQQLLENHTNERVIELVAPEIFAAFKEGTIPKEMQDSFYQQQRAEFFKAEDDLDALIRNLNDTYCPQNRTDVPGLLRLLQNQQQYYDLQRLESALKRVEKITNLVLNYCKDLTTYTNFIKNDQKAPSFLKLRMNGHQY